MLSVVVCRGRPSWVVGTKLSLFESSLDEWQAAKDKGLVATGIFYDNFTKRFIATFGWGHDLWLDKDCPLATQWESVNDHTRLTNAEVEERRQYAKMLRAVSIVAKITCTYILTHAAENRCLLWEPLQQD